MDSMTNVGRGKFLWTTTNELLKLRTLFGAESRDGRSMNTSGRGKSKQMACIKHSKDSVLLRGERDLI